jgi:hypothetical protein
MSEDRAVTPINDDTAILPMSDDTEADLAPVADDEDAERHDDLATALAKAAPRHWWNRGTIVLGALVLVAGGFIGGIQAQKQWGTASTAAGTRPAFNANRTGGYPNFAGGGFAGAGGTGTRSPSSTAAAGTTGTVKLVDGSTIYVQTADGNTVIVKTTGKTTVSTAAKGSIKDIKAGQTVTVQGSTGSDGSVSATSVTSTGK